MLQIAKLLLQVVLILLKNFFTATDGLLNGIKRQKITDFVLYLHPSYHLLQVFLKSNLKSKAIGKILREHVLKYKLL